MPYFAVDYGLHQLEDGTVLDVGYLTTTTQQAAPSVGVQTGWDFVPWRVNFASKPAVLAAVQTMNNEERSPPSTIAVPFLTAAVDSLSSTGVNLALERSEAALGSVVKRETLAYAAISAGQGSFTDPRGASVPFEALVTGPRVRGWSNGCTRVSFDGSYGNAIILASMAERNDDDGGWLRQCYKSSQYVDLRVDEDTHTGGERHHSQTRVSVLVFEQGFTYRYCGLGSYCPLTGNGSAIPCPAGTFGDSTHLTEDECSGPCHPGYYCPAGSTSPQDESRKCKAGRYGGVGSATEECSGACAAGHYCPAGSTSPTPHECGSVDVYCPTGSSAPTSASDGEHTIGDTESTRTSVETCPRGYYCTQGQLLPCPAGRYGSEEGLNSSTCSGRCRAGYFCPTGSTSPTQEPCGIGDTPAEYYCEEGTPVRAAVNGSSQHTTPADGNPAHRTSVADCDGLDGFVCLDGQLLPDLRFTNCPDGETTRRVKELEGDAPVGEALGAAAEGGVPEFAIRSVSPGPDSLFHINTTSGQLYTRSSGLDYRDYQHHVVEVEAGVPASAETIVCAMQITVINVNQPPSIPSGQEREVKELSAVDTGIGAPVLATDPDLGQSLVYEIVAGDNDNDLKIEQCSGQLRVRSPDLSVRGKARYDLVVNVTDDGLPPLGASATGTGPRPRPPPPCPPLTRGRPPSPLLPAVVVNILETDQPPVVQSGRASVPENSPMGTVVARVNATDPNTAPVLTFTFKRPSSVFAIDNATGEVTVAQNVLDYELQRLYPLQVQVTDETGMSDVADLDVEVRDEHEPPQLSTTTLYIEEGVAGAESTSALEATAEPGSAVTYSLVEDAGGLFTIGSSSGVLSVASGSLNYEVQRQYSLRVAVTDSEAASVTSNVTVTVLDRNDPPDLPDAAFSVPETLERDSPVGTPLNGSDEDAGQVLLYSIEGAVPASGAEVFEIQAFRGQLMLERQLDDALVKQYTLYVRAQDNGSPPKAVTANVTVFVEHVNKPPVVGEGHAYKVKEGSAIGTVVQGSPLAATDPDHDNLTFEIVPDQDMPTLLAMDAHTGELTVAGDIDYEQYSTIVLQVNVSDSLDLWTSTAVGVTVMNVEEPPVFIPDADAGEADSVVLATLPAASYLRIIPDVSKEGFPLGSDVFVRDPEGQPVNCSVIGPAAFRVRTLSDAGDGDAVACRLETATSDALESGNYTLTLIATDAAGNRSEANVSLVVEDTNDPPNVPSALERAVPEFSAVGTSVGDPLSANATDPNQGQALLYTLYSGNSEGIFALDNRTGQITVAQATLDHLRRPTHLLFVRVEDDGVPQFTVSTQVLIKVTNVPEPPTLGDTARRVDETAQGGADVGPPLQGHSNDASPLAYSMVLAGPPGVEGQGPFEMQSGGQVVVRSDADLDYEEPPNVFKYTVVVTDDKGLEGNASLTVSVNNVNEPPTAASVDGEVLENATAGHPVAHVQASDPDAEATLTYTIVAGNEQGAFSVDSATGWILVSEAGVLDYENVDSYTLTVNVRDNGIPFARGRAQQKSVNATASIRVLDVNDLSVDAFDGSLPMATGGGSFVYINGTNFGPTAFKGAEASIGEVTYRPVNSLGRSYSAKDCEMEVQNTRIRCTAPPGVGQGLHWTVHVGDQSGTSSVATRYKAPLLRRVTGAGPLGTNSSAVLRLRGDNLGPVGTYAAVQYVANIGDGDEETHEARDCRVVIADKEVQCAAVPGVGTDLRWTAQIGGQASNELANGSYAAPTVADVRPLDGPTLTTRGGDRVAILGTNLGPRVERVEVQYGPQDGLRYRARDCTFARPHAELTCLTVPGAGSDLVWTVTVGGQRSAPSTVTTNYKRPQLSRIVLRGSGELATEGGEAVVLRGSELGPLVGATAPRPRVRYGQWPDLEFEATLCKVTAAHSEVVCETAPGTGANLTWTVEVGGQTSLPRVGGNRYAPPTVLTYGGPGAEDATTAGGQLVRITGRSFGTVARNAVERVTYSSGAEGGGGALRAALSLPKTFVARECNVTRDHTEVTCLTAVGAGDGLSWQVVVDGQASKSPTTEYASPSVSSIDGPSAKEASTDGGGVVVVRGTDFGPPHGGFLDAVTYGPSGDEYAAHNCSVTSHTSIRCRLVPGVGGSLKWVVRVAGQGSSASTATSSYAAPSIEGVEPDVAQTDGRTEVEIRGANFGLLDPLSAVGVTFGGRQLTVLSSFVDEVGRHVVRTRIPPGEGTGGVLVLRTALRSGAGTPQASSGVALPYAAPHISLVTTSENTPSTMLVRIEGENFGTGGEVLINGVAQPLQGSWSHNLLEAVFEGDSGDVVVRTGGQESNVRSFTYFSPSVSSIALGQGASSESARAFRTAGGALISIEGEFFGEVAVNVTVGGKPCRDLNATMLDPEQQKGRIRCLVPPGQGRDAVIVVYRGGQRSTNQPASYLPPAVTSFTPSPLVVPTVGAQVTLDGDNFGLAASVTLLAARGGPGPAARKCEVAGQQHSRLVVDVPAGEGADHDLIVAAGDQTSQHVRISYLPPSVAEVAPATASTAPGAVLELSGANFGRYPPRVWLGHGAGAPVCNVTQHTQDSLRCTLLGGEGADLPVVVAVAGQNSTQTVPFAFQKPVVSSVAPRVAPTAGGPQVAVRGRNLGRNGRVELHSIASSDGTAETATVQVPPENVVSWSHTEVVFRVPPGQGADRAVVVRAGGQASPASSKDAAFAYAPPSVASVSPDHGPTTGGTLVNVTGENFGLEGLSVTLATPVGNRPCTVLRHDHTWATCRTPKGVGAGLDLSVAVYSRASDPVTFSYDPPQIEYVSPNVADAEGSRIEIRGHNFGDIEDNALFKPEVAVGDLLCENTRLLLAAEEQRPYIECQTVAGTVGWKNLTVTVAGQTNMWRAADRVFRTECKRGWYGREGEVCLECPPGGECAGRGKDPVPQEGWFNIPLSNRPDPDPQCPAERRERPNCTNIVPCEPKAACEYNNTCAEGYTAVRCAECDERYYRLDGLCEECPDNPWLLITGFILTAAVLATAGFWLSRRVSLGFVSIVVDYFQVLAVFARSRVQWPPALKRFLLWLSVFNFNIELTAPECAIPSVTYRTKWALIELLPVGMIGIFLLMHIALFVQKRFIKGRTKKLNTHVNAMVGAGITMFYYLYLLLTRTTLAIFNCSPTNPPDGHLVRARARAGPPHNAPLPATAPHPPPCRLRSTWKPSLCRAGSRVVCR